MAQSVFFAATLITATVLVLSSAEEQQQCGVYLAESSTDHVLGSYAGRSYKRDDVVGQQDAVIHFTDIRHYNRDRSDEDNTYLENFLATCWSGDATGGSFEADEVISALGGPCFSSTGHVGMINAVIYQPPNLLRSDTDLVASGYDETTSPGRGAFTTHHNVTLLAVDNIPPGMELFLDFGQEYTQYDDTSKPNMDDYRKMDEAMRKMVDFFAKHAEAIGETAAAEVYEFMKKDVLDLTAEKRAEAARSLLPDTYHGLQEIIRQGGSALHSHPEVVKDIEWLQEHGYCQDNLRAGVSSIPHAGRGAFAARNFKSGEVVAPMPLVALIRGSKALDVIDVLNEDEDDTEKVVKETKQLLMNYMLEHPQSSALFFPAGSVTAFVNHGGSDANVKMRWSSKSWSDVAGSHKIPVDELSEIPAIDMMLELVATKEIKEGEEVLLDYGDDWADAWKAHVDKWEEITRDLPLLKSAMSINDIHHGPSNKPFPTPSEGPADAKLNYDNVELHCFLLYDEDKIERRRNQDGTRTKVYPWIPHPADGEKRLKTDIAVRGTNRMPCLVLERTGDESSGYKYLVQPVVDDNKVGVLIKNVPHYAIRYADKPYMNPQFEETAFRKPIGFPDEIFPEAWKDLSGNVKK